MCNQKHTSHTAETFEDLVNAKSIATNLFGLERPVWFLTLWRGKAADLASLMSILDATDIAEMQDPDIMSHSTPVCMEV